MTHNGWTNWETWVTVTWLEDLRSLSADEISDMVYGLFDDLPDSGLVRDLLEGSFREINFHEIAKAFEPGEHEVDGYECDLCGDPARFYNGDTDGYYCEECN